METIRFWDVSKSLPKPKATIHKNGKLGFNKDAEKTMNLSRQPSYMVGTHPNDEAGETLYLVETEKRDDPKVITAAKAGRYYYLALRNVFDRLELNYKNQRVIYDIEQSAYENGIMYVLRQRTIDRKDNET